MHTTHHEGALAKPASVADSTVFPLPQSLSDREVIQVGSDLAGTAQNAGGIGKRLADVVLASLLLVVLLPAMIIVGLVVAMTSRGPIFFRHQRVGCKSSSFSCYKFRTMRLDAEAALATYLAEHPTLAAEWDCTQKLRHDPRVTSVGTFLRQSSLDELPQLVNVIKGDMSLVGPRPIVRTEVPKYGRYITSYFSVKPGLTGVWQVTGRNDCSYRRRVAADTFYARSRSGWLDLKILVMTVPAVLSGKGSC